MSYTPVQLTPDTRFNTYYMYVVSYKVIHSLYGYLPIWYCTIMYLDLPQQPPMTVVLLLVDSLVENIPSPCIQRQCKWQEYHLQINQSISIPADHSNTWMNAPHLSRRIQYYAILKIFTLPYQAPKQKENLCHAVYRQPISVSGQVSANVWVSLQTA